MTQKCFLSLHSDGVHRQICIGDVIVTLRPRFKKNSFPLRIPLGTFMACVLAKRSKSADIISRHFLLEIFYTSTTEQCLAHQHSWETNIRKGDLFVLLTSARSFTRVAWLALERSQRCASASSFCRNKSRGLGTLTWRALFLPSSWAAGSVHS